MTTDAAELLSVLIVSYNTRDHLRRCLRSLEKWPATIAQEVLVIDNASSDGSADMVAEEFTRCRLFRSSSNDGYGVAINFGVRRARGSWFLFLNPDVEVCEGTMDTLLRFARSKPRAGVVGPRLLTGDGHPQPSARRFLSTSLLLLESSRLHLLLPARLRSRLFLGTYFAQDEVMDVPWISGACHLLPRSVWETVGPLTEETFCGSDDYDYCYRTRRLGFEVWLCPTAVMIHHGSVAVRQRWSMWEVEQVAMNNFYVVLESHWSAWRLKVFYAAESLSCFLERARHRIKPRHEQDAPEESYSERLKRRQAFYFDLLVGRKKPIHRFQPADHGQQQSA